MKPQQRIRAAVSKAQAIIASYIQPGERDAKSPINELAGVLDDEKVVKAWKKPMNRSSRCERSRTGAF